MTNMRYRQSLSIAAGFGAIGLLSSVFAKVQGIIWPVSLTVLGRPGLSNADCIQLVIKLICLALSNVLGGMLIKWIGGNRRAGILAGILIMAVIAWLWLNTRQPDWFWIISFVQVIPAVLLGGDLITRYLSHRDR